MSLFFKKSIKNMTAWANVNEPDYASLSLMPDYKICGGSKSAGCMELCLKGSGFAKIFKTVIDKNLNLRSMIEGTPVEPVFRKVADFNSYTLKNK